MASESTLLFSIPSNRVLQWLINPGKDIPKRVAEIMLAEHFASAGSIVAAVLNSLVFNSLALVLHGGPIFYVLLTADLLSSGARLLLILRVAQCRKTGAPTPTDLYLVVAVVWAAMQGAIGFAAMHSNISTLQTISGIVAIMIAGGITYRNYPSPRYAMLLFSLIYMPMLCGVISAQDYWLRMLILTTPLYYFASIVIIGRLQQLTIDSLMAHHDSQFRATHDPLTELLNRGGLEEAIRNPAVAGAARLTVFYFDLDGFKQVNDTHGHPVGDKLLRMVGQRLSSGIRSDDVGARIGGDEFVVLAPNLPPNDAEILAARLTHSIALPYEVENVGTLRIGVSIGFACAPEDSKSVPELCRMADVALYDVKSSGKGASRRFTERRMAVAG